MLTLSVSSVPYPSGSWEAACRERRMGVMWHCDSRRRKVSRDVTRTPRILHGGMGGLEINDGKRNGYHPLSTASIIMY